MAVSEPPPVSRPTSLAGLVGGLVLAGGAARRMGGMDKATLTLGGITLLDRVLGAARPLCDRLAVVGGTRPATVPEVRFVQESPPGGGPVPAVVAGLDAMGGCEVVLVLAVDLPLLATADLRRLLMHLEDDSQADAVAATDERRLGNPLLAAYRASALRRAVRTLAAPGVAAARLLPSSVVFVDLGRAALNVNHPGDLEKASALLSAGTDPV